jgi:hypothetical protein
MDNDTSDVCGSALVGRTITNPGACGHLRWGGRSQEARTGLLPPRSEKPFPWRPPPGNAAPMRGKMCILRHRGPRNSFVLLGKKRGGCASALFATNRGGGEVRPFFGVLRTGHMPDRSCRIAGFPFAHKPIVRQGKVIIGKPPAVGQTLAGGSRRVGYPRSRHFVRNLPV